MNLFRKFLRNDNANKTCTAVILAAGSSERMGTDKVMLQLGDKPVLARTLRVFQDTACITDIIVVTRADKIEEVADLCKRYDINKVSKVCCGGKTRMESSLAGVSEVAHSSKLVAIHDAARPLVTPELITRVVDAAANSLAAIPAIACVDTLKRVDKHGKVAGNVDRSSTMRVQTPQVFSADLIKGALSKAVTDNAVYTDDCAAIEAMGVRAVIVEGDENNLKLTNPKDMLFAKAILRDRGEYL